MKRVLLTKEDKGEAGNFHAWTNDSGTRRIISRLLPRKTSLPFGIGATSTRCDRSPAEHKELGE